VTVVVEGLLGLGVAYHARFDPQAKGLGEWRRSRHVEIPEGFGASVTVLRSTLDPAAEAARAAGRPGSTPSTTSRPGPPPRRWPAVARRRPPGITPAAS